jgi:hypothetical protein
MIRVPRAALRRFVVVQIDFGNLRHDLAAVVMAAGTAFSASWERRMLRLDRVFRFCWTAMSILCRQVRAITAADPQTRRFFSSRRHYRPVDFGRCARGRSILGNETRKIAVLPLGARVFSSLPVL